MIDIKLIRENPNLVKENINKKFQQDKLKLVDEVLRLDEEWRKIKYQEDSLRSERNKVSLKINELKKAKKDAGHELKKAKEIPGKIAELEEKRKKLEDEIKEIMFKIPNIIHKSVPIGKDASQNKVVKVYGSAKKAKVKSHVEIGEELGVLDFDNSASVAGKGFYFMKGDLALLNMALINYARDFMIEKKFEYIEPPLMIRKEILDGVYSNSEIEQMAYKIEGEDLYLIATSEHPLIGQFIGKTLLKKDVPILQTAYSMCFRKEIGSHGIDEKGIFRTHQFNKQEMIVICDSSDSYTWFENMMKMSVELFKKLEIPFRVIEICSGDLGDLKSKQYDFEAWSPKRGEYFEITSLSNLESAQARRLDIRIDSGKERYFAHTLNNTVIATSRVLVAMLENFQQKNGSVKIPKVLWNYTGFKKIEIKKEKEKKVVGKV
ncbi:MAG: serine--tRNA ligase [Nanoarchaeota archaeon]